VTTERSTEDEPAAAVAVEALTVGYGPVAAVHGISLSAHRGEVLTLLGPSGCGKTTTLRAIAGLETPQQGRIAINGRVVFDAAMTVNLPPERRGLAMVFQSYAIWPHMTVFENVAFGLRTRGVRNSDVAAAVRRSLDLVGLGTLAQRPATRLSGGQQQRVALARSIAASPGVILLDEPLSNLDPQLRLAMRTEFRELQRRLGLTAIYVTHDQEEALVLSDRILVMRDGAIEQAGAAAEIYDTPKTRFAAEFVGVRNILRCEIGDRNREPVALLPGGVRLAARPPLPDGPACVCFRPINVCLSPQPRPGMFPATLTAATYLGDLMQYELRAAGFVIWARARPRADLAEGAPVFWLVPPDACFLVAA
jgi:iron(III) transport system ATP-binding protein